MSSAGVGPLAIYQEILEHFILPSADKLYGDADFIFQQDLAPVHTAKGTKSWFNDHGVTVLDWPANSPDLNPIENLWGIVKRKMRDTRPNNADELKATVKETWASIPNQQCHKLITSMPRQIEAVIKGIVHFEIKIWYLSAYPKGIQDVGVFFSSVDPILMFLGQTVLVCQSYNGRYRSLSL